MTRPDWEEQFDKKFLQPNVNKTAKDIKDFIAKTLEQQKQLLIEKTLKATEMDYNPATTDFQEGFNDALKLVRQSIKEENNAQ